MIGAITSTGPNRSVQRPFDGLSTIRPSADTRVGLRFLPNER